MANGNTCGGADGSLPPELLDALREYIRKNPTEYPGRRYLDQVDCCLLDDFFGTDSKCDGENCKLGKGGKKTKNHDEADPI